MEWASDFVECLKIDERGEEVYRSPLWAAECRVKVDPPGQIPHETVLGPIALMRLLTRLAKNGILESAQTWTALPDGCAPKTSLAQVKQITSHDVIKKLLSLFVKRVAARREQGVTSSTSGSHYYTRFMFVPGAELAHVLLQFDEATGGRFAGCIRGTRRELVLCLQQAGEASMKVKEYEPALGFFLGAVAATEVSAPVDGVPRELVTKIKKRVAEVQRLLRSS